MSIKALQDYTVYAKYARYDEEKQRRETWEEQIDRVFGMHERKYAQQLEENGDFKADFEFAKEQVLKKRVLGSQRALQFGGDPIERANAKMFNCIVSYCDRSRFFQECMYLLLCGCGTGFSVQHIHVSQLPDIAPRTKGKKKFVIPDSIEGWADALGALVNSYFVGSEFSGYEMEFDYSEIRPEGALIRGGFKAPGHQGLKSSLEKIAKLIDDRLKVCFEDGVSYSKKLRPIDAYDIVMHASDAVLSGGVRRSATICIFSHDDDEMLNAKTGSWFVENPQRGRSNNSALLIRDKTTKDEFSRIMQSVKEFGEPAFVWAEDAGIMYNPCVEIGFYPSLDIKTLSVDKRERFKASPEYVKGQNIYSGWQACNLCEINGRKIKSLDDFKQAARAASIIGTLQAGYTEFKYLGLTSQFLVEQEALLGVSMTGMMDSPEVLFNPDNQKAAAQEVLNVNESIARYIGINRAARATCVKPAGSTSCVLGSSSGIHPHHSRRYFRRVQANKLEFPAQEFMKHNPAAVENSVWSNSGTDMVITFLCEVPQGSIIKNQLSAIELLNKVMTTQQNWVEAGTRPDLCIRDFVRHNVSNTITVKPEEWDDITDFIFENRYWFAGISLLPSSGDKDYPQAPFCSVPSLQEYARKYGEAGLFASGLVVDGLSAFNNNLWAACDSALGIGEQVPQIMKEPVCPARPVKNGYSSTQFNTKLIEYSQALQEYYNQQSDYDVWWYKKDWLRRAEQFAERYFDGDLRQMTYCLKDCSNIKLWNDLSREYTDIDWSNVIEKEVYLVKVDETGAQACAGGKCEI